MKHGPSERDSVTLWSFTDEEAADPSMGGNLIHIKDMVKKRQSCKGGPQKDYSEYLEDVLVDFSSLLPVVHFFCGDHQFAAGVRTQIILRSRGSGVRPQFVAKQATTQFAARTVMVDIA